MSTSTNGAETDTDAAIDAADAAPALTIDTDTDTTNGGMR